MSHRVVVTGTAGICPLGETWREVRENLLARRSRVTCYPEWDAVEGLRTRLGAGIPQFESPGHYSRKKLRTIGRVALLAARSTELALIQAGLLENGAVSVACGVAFGSTSGSPPSIRHYAQQVAVNRTLTGVSASEYIKFMSHTAAANLVHFFGIEGRLIPACSACTSGAQAIGLAYESIKHGKQRVMIAGGAEELHVLAATVFDIMHATSTRNHEPTRTPRPFDRDRDGLVVGEGAATLVLESLDHARDRDAEILAELVGFGNNCNGSHILTPSAEDMQAVMSLALADAALPAEKIGYVNAHGTATEADDIAESQATAAVFGRRVPIASLKSYMGHTLGASGALESWIAVNMMREGWFAPTINLETVDPRCAPLGYLTEVLELETDHVMNNNFAFGGVNTSLIFRRWRP